VDIQAPIPGCWLHVPLAATFIGHESDKPPSPMRSNNEGESNSDLNISTTGANISGGETTIDVASEEVSCNLPIKQLVNLCIPEVTPGDAGSERWIQLVFTWAGKTFTLDIAESDRVFDLKAALQSLTDVPPERQKILGLVKGKLPPDQERV